MLRRSRVNSFIFIVCLLTVSRGWVGAQSYNFRNYSVEDGLPFINVSAIYQDTAGYLWCGGYGGVSRFDGFFFANYSPKNGLVNNSVNSIVQDKKGSIWFGTIGGLSRFVDNHFISYTKANGIPGNKINTLYVDHDNKLWIGTRDGLTAFDGKSFLQFTSDSHIERENITSVLRDSYFNLWIATKTRVYRVRVRENTIVTDFYIDFPHSITALCLDDQNNMWIGTDQGVYRYSNGLKEHYLGDSSITAIIKSKDNKIWIGTQSGIVVFDGQGFTPYHMGNSLNSNLVSSLFEDREENIWIGTYSGLYRFRGGAFISYTENEGLKNSFVYGMVRDEKSNLWIGTGDGLYNFNGTLFKRYSTGDGLIGNHVYAVIRNDSKSLWVGTERGLSLFDGVKFRNYTSKEGLANDSVITLFMDSRKNLWIGGHRGVTRYNGKTFSSFNYEKENRDYDVSSIVEDKTGAIWTGAYQGSLYRYSNNHFECMEKPGVIKSNAYMALLKDKDGYLFAGTFDGLFIYDGTGWNNISSKDGLSSDLVYSMVFDSSGNYLWLGTNQGINRIDIARYKKNKQVLVQSYSKEDGFQGVECNTNSAFLDKDGSLWFGTVSGLVHYIPALDKLNKVEPMTNIKQIQVFDRDTLLAKNARLPYNLNYLSFEFVGISLSNPQKVKYRYFLEGFDKDWSPETKFNIVNYSNLPPGHYTFNVKSSNNEGVWNTQATTFSFFIATPYWKTWWFRMAVLLAIFSSVFAGVRMRIAQIRRKERAELKHEIDLMDYELKALRAQMNPHFIFNSLNSIQHFIVEHDEDSANKYLNKFARLIRLILNNSESPTISLREELEALTLYLELEKMRFGNRFEYFIRVSSGFDQDFCEIPSMLLQPYVENAILHGLMPRKGNGLLEINISLTGNSLLCIVQDNGVGRKKSQQLKEKKSLLHKSVGMKITQERLLTLNKMHNSELSVSITDLYNENGESSGTKVEIYIPLK